MGTFDLKAGILTSAGDHRATFADVNAPVLKLGQTLIVLPCGSKCGWEDDRQHRETLERVEALGGRVVTVESEIARTTVDAPASGASWLIMQFVDNDAQVADPEQEAIVRLPVNAFRLRVEVVQRYPTQTKWLCVVQLPAGLSMADAEWFGWLLPDAADD